MPATALDSVIFRDIFCTEAMRRVFSDETRVQYLDIEAALARVQARLGIIPAEAAAEIERHCHADEFDFAKLKTQTERIGYPVLPVVQQLVKLCARRPRRVVPLGRDDAGHHRHRDGAADPRRARRWSRAICTRSPARSPISPRYRDTPMAGRSNLQQAVPITFGYKVAALLAGFDRHLERLASCGRACWSASSAAPPARSPRSARTVSRSRRA